MVGKADEEGHPRHRHPLERVVTWRQRPSSETPTPDVHFQG